MVEISDKGGFLVGSNRWEYHLLRSVKAIKQEREGSISNKYTNKVGIYL